MPILAGIAGFSSGTRLVMYEEVKPNLIEKIEFTEGVLEKEMDELMDGDIIIVQKDEPGGFEEYKKPTPKEYSRLESCTVCHLGRDLLLRTNSIVLLIACVG